MTDIYSKTREDLEDRLEELGSPDVSTELQIYDTIVKAKNNWLVRLEADIRKKYGKKHGEFYRIGQEFLNMFKQYRNSVDDPDDCDQIFEKVIASPEYNSAKEDFMKTRLIRAVHYAEEYGEQPAFIVLYNYDPKKHDDGIVKANYSHPVVGKKFNAKDAEEHIFELAYSDGAIVLNEKTNILFVEGELDFHPDIHKGTPRDKKTINESAGFKTEVSLRHAATRFGSYNMPGVIAYVLGAEARMIRRLEHGINTASTHPDEAGNLDKIVHDLKMNRNAQHI